MGEVGDLACHYWAWGVLEDMGLGQSGQRWGKVKTAHCQCYWNYVDGQTLCWSHSPADHLGMLVRVGRDFVDVASSSEVLRIH